MNATITWSAVELRLREKRGRLAENLVRAFAFEVLAFELLQAGPFVAGQAGTLPGVSFGPADPPTQRLAGAAQFLRH
jgi:hypothetical protein